MADASSGATRPDENEQDRLSDLPDDVLLLILSLVPTVDAVQTSILSRRWRYLWTSVDTLDFDDSAECYVQHYGDGNTGKRKRGVQERENGERDFVEFVNKVFAFHHTPALQKFRLSCSATERRPVEDWVRAAIARGVRELDLRFRLEGSARLPSLLFVSHSLVDLKLDLMGSTLKLPAGMGFPLLRTMHLHSVSFEDGHPTCQLFSSCTSLRSLSMVNCTYPQGRVEISCPLLESLTIDSPSNMDGLGNCTVKISTPKLWFLKYRASLAQAYDLGQFPSLVTVKAQLWRKDNLPYFNRVHGFLQQLTCAKNLKICRPCALTLATKPGCTVQFRNLTTLRVTSDRLDRVVIYVIVTFLANCPSLKSVLVKPSRTSLYTSHDPQVTKESLLKVVHGYSPRLARGVLERAEIRCSNPAESIIELVKVLLSSQARLQTLVLSSCLLCDKHHLHYGTNRHFCGRKEMMEVVLAFPRRSSNIVIAFLQGF